MKRPQVIFFDAVGTLFGVRGSVGEVYRQLAATHGVIIDATQVDLAFYHCFKAASPCAFPSVDRSEIQRLEYQWWETIAEATFEQIGVLNQFQDFPQFFSDLYAHFETAEPWFIYNDTLPTLDRLRKLNIPLGVLSNFDSRLYLVLKALGLFDYFSSITISTEAGYAKPDPQIFAIALEKHNCPASAAWHIGDSPKEDYEAAKAAGLRGVLVQRDSK
jgi:putative hydrolase of the HAD superfamily